MSKFRVKVFSRYPKVFSEDRDVIQSKDFDKLYSAQQAAKKLVKDNSHLSVTVETFKLRFHEDWVDMCQDCLIAYYNDDYSSVDYYCNTEHEALERIKDIKRGLWNDFNHRKGFLGFTDSVTSGDTALGTCACCGIRGNVSTFIANYQFEEKV